MEASFLLGQGWERDCVEPDDESHGGWPVLKRKGPRRFAVHGLCVASLQAILREVLHGGMDCCRGALSSSEGHFQDSSPSELICSDTGQCVSVKELCTSGGQEPCLAHPSLPSQCLKQALVCYRRSGIPGNGGGMVSEGVDSGREASFLPTPQHAEGKRNA